jgi:hypothetical protein
MALRLPLRVFPPAVPPSRRRYSGWSENGVKSVPRSK